MARARHAHGGYWGQINVATQLLNTATAQASNYKYNLVAGETMWVTTEGALYVCTDPTPGSAMWAKIDATGGDGPSAGTSVKLTNTDVTTNLAGTATVAFSELTGAVAWNDDNSLYIPNLAAGSVTLNLAGRFRAEFAAAMSGGLTTNTQRNNIRFAFTINGTQISPNFQGNYMRDASGHNEVSESGFVTFEASAGDVLAIVRQRVAGSGGTQTLEGTNNFLMVSAV